MNNNNNNKDSSLYFNETMGTYDVIDGYSDGLIKEITRLTKKLEDLLALKRGISKYEYLTDRKEI